MWLVTLAAARILSLLLCIGCLPQRRWSGTAWQTEQLCGAGGNWTYEPVAGLCLDILTSDNGSSQPMVAKEAAVRRCSAAGGILLEPTDFHEILGVEKFLSERGMAAKVWAGAVRAGGGEFRNPTLNVTTPQSLLLPPSADEASTDGNCSVFVAKYSANAGGWATRSGLRAADCTLDCVVLCCKRLPRCNRQQLADSVPNVVASNVSLGQLLTDVTTVGLRLRLPCANGYSRARDSPTRALPTPAPTAAGIAVNEAECDCCTASGLPFWRLGVVEKCAMTVCKTQPLKEELTIPNVEPYSDQLQQGSYNFSESFALNCSRGYVYYANASLTTGVLTCGQNLFDPTKEEWLPPDLNVCKAVSCPAVDSVLNEQTQAYKAVNRIKQREYNEFQRSSFPFYPNRVHISCKQIGYFFEDRTFEKTILCDLKNGSRVEGAWHGTLGTSLSRLPTENCIQVSCLSDSLLPRTGEGEERLQTLQYENSTLVKLPNGTSYWLHTSLFNSQELYAFGTVVAFSCAAGTDTGVGQPIAVCTDTGNWNITVLPLCTRQSERINPQGKRYTPPAVEAKQANSIGALAIIICIIFAVNILILDLSTLSRDLRLFKKNLRRLSWRLDAD